MGSFVLLSVSLIFCVVIGLLFMMIQISMNRERQTYREQVTNLSTLLNSERTVNRDLLNRLMSEDLRTYTALSTNQPGSPIPSSTYVSMSDKAEVQRLIDHGIAPADAIGLGETNYDDADILNGLNGFP